MGVAAASVTFVSDITDAEIDAYVATEEPLLVAGAFTDSYSQGEGKKQQSVEQEPLPFRFTVDLVMIEVQSGEYLGEDDIERLDDVYGRA